MAVRDSAYDKILKASAKLFASKGYAATTTRMIVAEAGSSLSAIHAHFKSKEGIYRAVMESTTETFYTLNEPSFHAIMEIEEQGILAGDTAWDQIVMLTISLIDWAYNPEYRYEILLMNQQMVGLGAPEMELPDSMYGLYRMYAKLFRCYTGNTEGDWPEKLAFYIVTSAFDGANYSAVLDKLLGAPLVETEGLESMKNNLRNYLLTNMRAQLEPRCRV